MKAKLTNRERKRLGLLIPQRNTPNFRPRRSRQHTRLRRLLTVRTLIAASTLLAMIAFWVAERFPEYTGDLFFTTQTRPDTGRLVQVRDQTTKAPTKTTAGRVTHVRDGDTIEVSGIPIRLGSLDCSEQGTPKGLQATKNMRRLVKGKRLSCRLNGRKSYDRYIGSCALPDGRDLAGIMIREGHCSRFW